MTFQDAAARLGVSRSTLWRWWDSDRDGLSDLVEVQGFGGKYSDPRNPDTDNDGLPDVYFISTNGQNRLYKNLGGLKFADITEKASSKGPMVLVVRLYEFMTGDGELLMRSKNTTIRR